MGCCLRNLKPLSFLFLSSCHSSFSALVISFLSARALEKPSAGAPLYILSLLLMLSSFSMIDVLSLAPLVPLKGGFYFMISTFWNRDILLLKKNRNQNSAKEEPLPPKRLLPKLKPLLPAHFRVVSVAIATFIIDVVNDVAEMGDFSIIDQLFGVGHQIAFGNSGTHHVQCQIYQVDERQRVGNQYRRCGIDDDIVVNLSRFFQKGFKT